jgi:hypothetical protein
MVTGLRLIGNADGQAETWKLTIGLNPRKRGRDPGNREKKGKVMQTQLSILRFFRGLTALIKLGFSHAFINQSFIIASPFFVLILTGSH